MTKKIIIIFTIFIFFFVVFWLIDHVFLWKQPYTPAYTEIINLPKTPSIAPEILDYNKKREQIRCISYPRIKIFTDVMKLQAEIAYKKDRFLKMTSWSILGKEVEIGSNNEYFWFWSKRMNPPALYYSNYQNIDKTRLKTPFNPNWLKELLGINVLNVEGAKIYQQENDWVIVSEKVNFQGCPIKYVYVLDSYHQCIKSYLIYDHESKPVVSVETTSFQCVDNIWYPQVMTFHWHEEDTQIKWVLDAPIVNTETNLNWEMPQSHSKISLTP